MSKNTGRIHPVSPETATGDVKNTYDHMQKSLGKVPNIFQCMANSPIVLQSFLSLSQSLAKTSLSAKLREEIALAVAQENQCHYCLAAHTLTGKGAGLKEQEILNARKGQGSDQKTQAILQFCKHVVEKKGHTSEEEIETLKNAGISDTEIVEIILAIQVNMFTNYFNNIVDTPVDFPAAPKLEIHAH